MLRSGLTARHPLQGVALIHRIQPGQLRQLRQPLALERAGATKCAGKGTIYPQQAALIVGIEERMWQGIDQRLLEGKLLVALANAAATQHPPLPEQGTDQTDQQGGPEQGYSPPSGDGLLHIAQQQQRPLPFGIVPLDRHATHQIAIFPYPYFIAIECRQDHRFAIRGKVMSI